MTDLMDCYFNFVGSGMQCTFSKKPRGSWNFIDYTNGALTLTYEAGMETSTERETSKSWEVSLTKEVKAGFDFFGAEVEVTVSGSATWASATAVRQAVSRSTKETNQKTFDKGGAFWQWQLGPHKRS